MVQINMADAPETLDAPAYVPDVAEGKGMFLIIEAEDLVDYVKITTEVLGHSDAISVGKKMEDRFWIEGKFAHKLTLLATACGIIQWEDVLKAQAAKAIVAIDEEALRGKVFCSSIKYRKGKQGGTFTNFGWDFESAAAGAEKGYPVDKEFVPA